MKKCLSLLLIALLLMGTLISGCSTNKEKDVTQETKATENVLKPENSTKMLNDYFNSKIEGKNPLYGIWQIQGVEYVNFIFRNDNLAEMVMGSEGSFTEMSVDEDKNTIELSFIIALNGKYKYKLSKDKKTLTLTQKGIKQVLEKIDTIDMIPKAPTEAKIDKKITGWWKNKNGLIYYFGKDGLMYSNIIMSETYYTYQAIDGVIHSVYYYPDEIKDSFGYKLTNKGKLKIGENVFSPFNPFE